MEPIPGPENTHPLTGNTPVSQAKDVNAIIRALADRKRRTRVDILGRTIHTNDNDRNHNA